MATIRIIATVAYPVCLEVHIPEEEVKAILQNDFAVLDKWKKTIKDEADKQFETSSISPVIAECVLADLQEAMP